MDTNVRDREEILKRVKNSMEKKKKRIDEMEKYLREKYKERTGKDAKYVESL